MKQLSKAIDAAHAALHKAEEAAREPQQAGEQPARRAPVDEADPETLAAQA
jgi:hypothetical protein